MNAILNIASYLVPVILALGILVFVHELGHFLAAKLFGMRVEQFSIGFPPKIASKKLGETEYRIGATPLGGYVKISGMVDESMDASFAASTPEPWEFRSKPVWQRIIVITAGVIFNLFLAALIFIGLKYAYGEDFVPADRVDRIYVVEGSVAHLIGFRTDDRVVEVNGEQLERFDDLLGLRSLVADQATFVVMRSGARETLTAPKDLVTQLSRGPGTGVFGAGLYAYPHVELTEVGEQTPARDAGLLAGDRVVSVDGQPVFVLEEMTGLIQESEGRPLELLIRRADESPDGIPATVDRQPSTSDFPVTVAAERVGDSYRIGVTVSTRDALFDNPDTYEHRPFGLGESITEGVRAAWISTVVTVQSFKKILTGQENVRESLGGPLVIGKVTKEALDKGWEQFWFIVAMLSITLAFINILPIPALDGGHLVFLIYEGIARREAPLRLRMVVQQIGMVLIIGLMVFLIVNDLLRLQ